jgi:hypothetical protein
MFDLYGVQDVYLFHYQSFFASNGRSGLTLQMLASQLSASHVPFLLYHFLGQKLGQQKVLEDYTVRTTYRVLDTLLFDDG